MTVETVEIRSRRLVQDQVNGIVIQVLNEVRIHDEIVQLAAQDAALGTALEQIKKVQEFIGGGSILGSEFTKHGEIAEHVEVGIRNARHALFQESMTATFEGVGRTAPMDYLIDGIAVQSKFINGIGNNLRHVIGHLEKYQDFTADGSYYIIPKDAYHAIQTLMNGGHVEGLRLSTEESVRALVRQVEEQVGKPFSELIQPSVVDYSDVQVRAVETTLDREHHDLVDKSGQRKQKIFDDHKPTPQGAAQAAVVGGAVAGVMSFGTGLYAKYKGGKNVFKGDFTEEDWEEIGIDTAQGAAVGAVAAGSIYLMTNYAGMAAPFASAVVSAAKGVGSLSINYVNGEISFDEFVDLGMVVCAESAIVGVATAAGQALIPIPVLGAVIGSLAGKMVAEFATGDNEEVARRLRDNIAAFRATLDDELTSVLDAFTAEFEQLNELTVVAFEFDRNYSLLTRSVELAQAYRVDPDKIIADEAALDAFMLA